MSCNMPDIPLDFPTFQLGAGYLYFEGIYTDSGELVGAAGLGFDPVAVGGLNFEVGVKPEFRSKWASRSLFKKIFDIGFNHFGADYLIAQSDSPEAMRALEVLGFQNIGVRRGKNVYTLHSIPDKYKDEH